MNPKLSGYVGKISDGYTRPGYVKERPHCYPAVRFEFRPVLVGERTEIFREQQKATNGTDEELISAGTICRYVKNWDLKDHAGNVVPLEVEQVMLIDANLFLKIYNIVTGIGETDTDPEWKRSENGKESGRLVEILGKHAPTPVASSGDDEKNSEAG